MSRINMEYLLTNAKQYAEIKIRKRGAYKFAEGDFGNYLEIDCAVKQYLGCFEKNELEKLEKEVVKISRETNDQVLKEACSFINRIVINILYPQQTMWGSKPKNQSDLSL